MMNKIINKNSIILTLAVILAFSTIVLMPMKASANGNYGTWTSTGVSYGGTNSGSPDGGTNYNNNYNNNNYYTNPVPIIYSITPNSMKTGDGIVPVVITGTNFVSGSLVQVNGSYKSTSYNSSNQLTVMLNSSELPAGTYILGVFNPTPGGGNSNGAYLTVTSSVAPSTISTGATTTATAATTSGTKAKVAKKATSTTNKDLTAGAGNGFLPTNFIQWLFAAILILLLVILFRKLYVTEKDKQAPLKHA
ncbi:MAG: hypothetical protein NTZ44_01690 [Candidatus Nomurabacteria bacterium]|nr:hypothetical protein [Candidatus Nomurabacteria bacterium]